MRVLAIIVNYRTAGMALDCVASLEAERKSSPGLEAIIVDGGSDDGSSTRIKAAIAERGWATWVTLLTLEENLGFAFGNNAGLRWAFDAGRAPDYVLFLNPDTVVRPGALRVLVDALEAHPEAGIAGSRLEDPDGTPQVSAFRFHSVLSELDAGLRFGPATKALKRWAVPIGIPATSCETDWVSGAAMLVRRKVLDDVGLLDEGYFLYYEDVDFCLAAHRAGWRCRHEPQSRIIHLVSQSTGGISETRMKARRRPRYWFDARRRYFIKNHGLLYALCADSAWLAGYSLWRCRRLLQRKQDLDPPRFLWDFFRNSAFLRGGVAQ